MICYPGWMIFSRDFFCGAGADVLPRIILQAKILQTEDSQNRS